MSDWNIPKEYLNQSKEIERLKAKVAKLEAAIVERDSIIARLLGDTTPVDGYCGRRSSKAGLQAGEAEE